jgi:hypothetical protein
MITPGKLNTPGIFLGDNPFLIAHSKPGYAGGNGIHAQFVQRRSAQ